MEGCVHMDIIMFMHIFIINLPSWTVMCGKVKWQNAGPIYQGYTRMKILLQVFNGQDQRACIHKQSTKTSVEHFWLNRWKDGWMERYIDRRLDGWMEGYVGRGLDGWWMDGWMDGWHRISLSLVPSKQNLWSNLRRKDVLTDIPFHSNLM